MYCNVTVRYIGICFHVVGKYNSNTHYHLPLQVQPESFDMSFFFFSLKFYGKAGQCDWDVAVSCQEGMLSLAKGGKQVKCIFIHYASDFLNEGMPEVN